MKRRQGCGGEEPRETSEVSPPAGVVRHSPTPDGLDHISNSDELGDISSSGCIVDVHEPGNSVDRDVSHETLGQMQQRHKRVLFASYRCFDFWISSRMSSVKQL